RHGAESARRLEEPACAHAVASRGARRARRTSGAAARPLRRAALRRRGRRACRFCRRSPRSLRQNRRTARTCGGGARDVKALAVLLVGALGLLLTAAPARAETPEQSYAAALAALHKGAVSDAIDRLELLADQGVLSENASLARAAAYLARADG